MTCNLISVHLTDEQKAQICGILSVGCDWQSAANFVGCSLADIRRAIDLDPQFSASVRRSEATAELAHMRTVQEAAKDAKNWRAATWWLERRAPERYGPRSAGVVTARQLKAYIGILADVLASGEESGMGRAQVFGRLKTFAESVDQLLRNERMLEPSASDAMPTESPDGVSGTEALPEDFDDAEFRMAD